MTLPMRIIMLAAAATLVSACAPRPVQPNQNQAPTPPTPSAQAQEQAYRREVVAILSPHFAGEQTTGITQQLLALTVPVRFQDLHLQLVLVFSKFDTARTNSDAEAAEAAAAQLETVLGQYPWINGQP